MSRIIFIFLSVGSIICAKEHCLAYKVGMRKILCVNDIEAVFPKNIEEIKSRKSQMIKGFNEIIEKILSQESPTFENCARLYDLAFGGLSYGSEFIESIAYVHPDPEMRLAAEKAATEIEKTISEVFNKHPDLYKIVSLIDGTKLSSEHQYYLEGIKKNLVKKGLNLSEEKRRQIKLLQDEIADLGESFSRNIREDRKIIPASKEDLTGMDDIFINSLEKDEVGNHLLTTDYPVVFPILSYCKVASTREKLYRAMHNRAYPENKEVLESLLTKRLSLANLLGYQSYADMQLESEMVETPLKAREFLGKVTYALKEKVESEYALLKNHLPEDVTLTDSGKIQPWNYGYILTQYKKEVFDLDMENLKDYFPLDKALKGLMEVYESFFDICIEEMPKPSLWHEDVRLVRVSDKRTDQTYGYVLLDLFPRVGKYTHACDVPLLPALRTSNGLFPALSLLICNFPKGTGDSPSLMRPANLQTFFHEFGHALHDMLGRTDLISTAGTNTKYDFVEMPSQILEEWLNNPEVLQMCSSHFETGEKLPLDMALKLIESKTSFMAHFWMRQVVLSYFSLDIHSGTNADLTHLWENLMLEHHPAISLMDEDYFYTSFGHLKGYGARYYGYLWSKVFALDVFEKIEKKGLLNPDIGRAYIRDIIGRGGSQDPNLYLKDFLGRKPTFDAFIKSIK